MLPFTFWHNELPEGAGFSLYGPEHLSFFAGTALAIVLTCIAYRRTKPENQLRFRRIVACICFALELGKQIIIFITLPEYPVSHLPLHLCGLGVFVQMADAFVPRWQKTTQEILYSLSLPGAAAALLFSDWTAYPILNVYCLQSFTIHGVLLCYPVMLFASGQMKPNWRNLWRPAVFLLVIAGPIYLLNRHFGTNFLFINGGSPGSPLELLESLMGNPGYLIGYAGLLIVVWLVMHMPFIVGELVGKRRRRTE